MKRIVSALPLLFMTVLLLSCEEGNPSEAMASHPLNARSEQVSEDIAAGKIPHFQVPDSAVHLSSTRKREPHAVVIKGYYRLKSPLEEAIRFYEGQPLTLQSKTEQGALFLKTNKLDSGGMEQIHLRIESFNPERKIHLGVEDFPGSFNVDLKAGNPIMRVLYRKRNTTNSSGS